MLICREVKSTHFGAKEPNSQTLVEVAFYRTWELFLSGTYFQEILLRKLEPPICPQILEGILFPNRCLDSGDIDS